MVYSVLIASIGGGAIIFILWITEVYQHIFRWLKTDEYRGGQACLTFKQFRSFYDMAPNKWLFGHERVSYKVAFNDEITFYFTTYGDKFKYQKWRAAVVQYQQTKKNLERLNRAMAAIREDIQVYTDDAIESSQENYQRIKENLSNEMDKSN